MSIAKVHGALGLFLQLTFDNADLTFGTFSLVPPEFEGNVPNAYFAPVKSYSIMEGGNPGEYIANGIFETVLVYRVGGTSTYADVDIQYYHSVLELLQVRAMSLFREISELEELSVRRVTIPIDENYPIRVINNSENTSNVDTASWLVQVILQLEVTYLIDEVLGPDVPVPPLNKLTLSVYKRKRDGAPVVVNPTDGYGSGDDNNPPNVLDLNLEKLFNGE